MRRREFIAGVGASIVVWPTCVVAQQSGSLHVGFLGAASEAGYAGRVAALRAGLHDLGYVEGKNLVFDAVWAEGRYDRLSGLAGDLVRRGVDVIVTHGTPGASAAKQATSTVPIVMAVSGDAVAMKIVASLARPGGNVTGSSFFSPELNAKRLSLFKDLLPRIGRIGFLVNPDNPISELEIPDMDRLARLSNLDVQPFKARSLREIEQVFSAMTEQRIQAVVMDSDGLFTANYGAIAGAAAMQRLPTMSEPDFAKAGGLAGYGPNFLEMFRRAATFIDKIAKGAKPGDLPIEQPTKFDFIVNNKAARSLGLELEPATLLRADEVIE
ncbi:MAG TPA: ABC transporter substrate-binding protein [Alphaproteobacteria bacterium]